MKTKRSFEQTKLAAIMAGTACLVLAPAGLAQDEGTYTDQDVRSLVEELRKTREEVKTLRSEVTELRAQTGENWMNEQRASEIRSIVQDVLIDADSRQSLLQGGGTAGWDNGFFLSSGDGNFLLEVDGLMQVRFIANRQEGESVDEFRTGYENTTTQLTLRGHIYSPDLEYLVRADVTRNEPNLVTGLFFLEDAWVRYRFTNELSMRFGQFKTPFNREELVDPGHQLAVERSLVNESMNLGRTQGIELVWANPEFRVAFATGDGGTDNLGGFNLFEPGGAPSNSNALLEDTEFSLTSRIEWKLAGTWEQFADFTSRKGDPFGVLVGVAAHWQRSEFGTPLGNDFFGNPQDVQDDWFAWTVDASVEFGGANLFASFSHHILETPNSSTVDGFGVDVYGAVIQGGWYMTDNVELFARYEWGQFLVDQSGTAFDTLNVVTTGVNWYLHGHDAKLTVDAGWGITEVDTPWDSSIAGWRSDGDKDNGQLVFRTQFQLRF